MELKTSEVAFPILVADSNNDIFALPLGNIDELEEPVDNFQQQIGETENETNS